MPAWVAGLDAVDGPTNWIICQRERLMGSGNSLAKAIRAGDEVFIWLSKSRFIGHTVALEDAEAVQAGAHVPWPDPHRYKVTFPIQVLADASAAPVGPRWNDFKAETGTGMRPDWIPRIPEASVPIVRDYFAAFAPAPQTSPLEQQILDSLELPDGDRRTVAQVMAVIREGQDQFRKNLLVAYDRRCAISGVGTEAVLDAAHISAYNGRDSNDVRNGLLLRRDLHSLFDRHLLTVRPDGVVHVDPDIDTELYRSVHGTRARFPQRSEARPDVALLLAHNSAFDNVAERSSGSDNAGR